MPGKRAPKLNRLISLQFPNPHVRIRTAGRKPVWDAWIKVNGEDRLALVPQDLQRLDSHSGSPIFSFALF